MRYVLVATVIVVLAIVILLRLPAPHTADVGSKFSSSTATPGPAQHGDVLRGTPAPFSGVAPWALSALPECLQQITRRSGPAAFARRGFPERAVRIAPGSVVRAADCSFLVGKDTIAVRRGPDRLEVPPDARLYRVAAGLLLDRRYGHSEDVRTYAFVRAK